MTPKRHEMDRLRHLAIFTPDRCHEMTPKRHETGLKRHETGPKRHEMAGTGDARTPPYPPQQMPRWGEARHLLKNLTLN